ncbi:helix-turn-helix transcriptional regulator [Streptomyces salinarius]|uniref:helix-turn-helix transcriptional regulator n=1 Tax=Streptomyces salinarius TaxID=2762598 RepID=UPI0028F6DAC9|nr:helix-turn-helix transcriptional regulator [Streptomyces salinarius]
MIGETHFTINYPAIASMVVPLEAGADVSAHNHPQHQLTWAPTGLLTMGVGNFRWVVQRSRALWIPGGVDHAVFPNSSVAMVSLYFEPDDCPLRWDAPTVIDATGLVGPLLSHLVTIGADAEDHRARVTAVLWDLMKPMSVATIPTILPTDSLARRVALAIKKDPADPRDLEDWGREVGASPRTLSRRFRAETGVSFASWRTYERLNAALPMLGMGEPISRVARAVGYGTASAFITAFRREIGTTPASYFGGSGAQSRFTRTPDAPPPGGD